MKTRNILKQIVDNKFYIKLLPVVLILLGLLILWLHFNIDRLLFTDETPLWFKIVLVISFIFLFPIYVIQKRKDIRTNWLYSVWMLLFGMLCITIIILWCFF